MHNPDQQAHHAHPQLHLAQRWHRARAAYRLANRASHHVLGFTVKLALFVYFLFTFVFLFLRYAVLPHIDYYKGDIETVASRALGSQVAITRIYASWRGLRPNLFLGDVILRDASGRQVLSLPSVSATLSWWSVLAASPRFDTLEIIRPDLDVRRDRDGKISVAGIVLDASKNGDSTGSDWLFAQREIIVREGRVRWNDELRGAPELALENLNLALLNSWNHHRFAIEATPPPALSGPLDIRADFTHPRFAARVSDVAQWTGELYGDLRNTDLAGWKPYLDYPIEITRGKGSLRAWLSLDSARLAAFTADLGLVDVSARLGRALPVLELARVSGRMSASERVKPGGKAGQPAFGANGHTVSLTGFTLLTRDGLALAPTTIEEAYLPAAGGNSEKFHLSARQLDLEALAKLAAQLPLTASQRTMLADLAPRGSLSNFVATWQGKYPAISAYQLSGRLEGLGMKPQPARLARAKTPTSAAAAAVPAIPGFDNISGTINASEAGGAIALDAQAVVLHMPAWALDASMPFDRLGLQARWRFMPKDQLLVELDSLSLAQGAMKASLSGRHQMPLVAQPGKPSGSVDLSGTFSGFDLKQLPRYLPLQTPPHLVEWLSHALEAGVLQDGSMRLRGELSQFPFRDPAKGEFRVAARLEDARLNYAPAQLGPDGRAPLWPQAELINGIIVFDRARLELNVASARTLGLALVNVKASVPDLWQPERMLDIDGGATGSLQEFLRYAGASPVAGWTGHFTDPTRASGNAKLALKLQMPLAHMKETRAQGALQLLGNDVMLFPELPSLQAAIGKIEFTERGFNLAGVGASFLGGPLALTGGSVPGSGILIRMGGTVSADGIRKTYPAAAVAPVTSRFSGSTRFTGAITVKDGQTQVTLDSTLAGMGLEFPAPLNKGAAEALPLHFTLGGIPVAAVAQAGASADSLNAREEIRLTLGSAVSARYLRQRVGKGPWKVLSGGIGVNVPAPEQEEGLMVNANMRTLNVDQWLNIGKRVAAAKPEAAVAGAEAGGTNLAQYVVPDVMAARATELIIGERKLDSVVVGASHQNQAWQASIDSRQVSGHVTWDEGPAGQGLGKVTARLASLVIPESAAADVKDLLEGGKSPVA
ncbi:MAG: TIGR02099 family protein, partial [Massilia sp.]|nr:TIGR02099 family protein [Massilia sp.]